MVTGEISVDDGIRPCNFQKMIQIFFQFGNKFGFGYVEIGLISNFLDANRERNFVELVDEIVDFTMPCIFRSFKCAGVDQVAVETA